MASECNQQNNNTYKTANENTGNSNTIDQKATQQTNEKTSLNQPSTNHHYRKKKKKKVDPEKHRQKLKEDREESKQVKEMCAARWATEQTELKNKLITSDLLDKENKEKTIKDIRYIGGVDISFVSEESNENGYNDVCDACAALIVLEFPSLKLVYEDYKMVTLTQPYIPGFLAFREVGFLIERLDHLKKTKPELMPQIIFVDGNGILHPRGFGLASHLGVLADIPTIGVAKKLFALDGLTRDSVAEQCRTKLQKGGETLELKGRSGKVWGMALRCTDDSVNPIFVSTGHRISLKTAVEITYATCLHRIPEPVRRADLGSRAEIRKWCKSHISKG